jgi:PAS domain S-box-containing protein
MESKILNSPRSRFTTISLFLIEYTKRFAGLPDPLHLDRYVGKFWNLLNGEDEMILDKCGKILTWNKKLEKINGYSGGEIMGQNISIIYLPEERQSRIPESVLEQARKNGSVEHTGVYAKKNGEKFKAILKIVAIRKGNMLLGFAANVKNYNVSEQ